MLILVVSRETLSVPIALLHIVYWYTRTTLTGISVLSILISFIGSLLREITDILHDPSVGDGPISKFGIYAVFVVWFSTPLYFSLRLISPFRVVWRGWVPSGVVRIGYTHSERASIRAEGKDSEAMKVAVSGVLGRGDDRLY